MRTKIRIDVVSDVACPWCYVGKKHLETALTSLSETEADIHWHPFQLDPTVPEEGADKEEHYTQKFGSMDRFDMLSQRVVQAGKNAGIDFHFDRLSRIPNTLKLHALVAEANKEGFGARLNEAFLSAYFEKGIDLTSPDEIVRIVSDFGWSEEKTRAIIEDKEAHTRVLQEINHYQNLGVNAVPFFIINNKYALSGAQPPEVFAQALTEIGKEISTNEGEACDIDDPNC